MRSGRKGQDGCSIRIKKTVRDEGSEKNRRTGMEVVQLEFRLYLALFWQTPNCELVDYFLLKRMTYS